jgi:hypothetical protein
MTMDGHERRILNEAIEQAYLEVSLLASDIESYFYTDNGQNNLLLKSFYKAANFLYRITANQDVMIDKAKEEIAIMRAWLDGPPPKDKDIDRALRDGILAFNKYDIALNQVGLITLPHKGK